MDTMSEQISIATISDDQVSVKATLVNLHVDFENECILINLNLIKESTHQVIGTVTEPKTRFANNQLRVKVLNPDGSPSMIPVLDADKNPIMYEVSPAQPIYEEARNPDGSIMLDDDGIEMLDENGQPIMRLVGHTDPVLAPLMEQETIGQFEYWRIKYKPLIDDIKQSALAAFDPSIDFELTYTKPVE